MFPRGGAHARPCCWTVALCFVVGVVFGQSPATPTDNNLDPNNWGLVQPQYPSLGPQLAYHAASQIVDPFDAIYSPTFTTNSSYAVHMAVFGGIFSFVSEVNNIWTTDANTQLTDNMWLFFISTRTWKQIPRVTGPFPQGTGWPGARAVHTLNTLIYNSNSVLVLFGGQNGSTSFGDTWLWPWTRNATHAGFSTLWYNATTAVSPGPRWGFGSAVHINTLYVMGGASFAQTLPNDVWIFMLTSETSGAWRLLYPAFVQGPYPRFLFSFGIFHNATTDQPQMLVTGGWPTVSNSDTSLPMRDMWTAPLTFGNASATSASYLNSSFANNPPSSVFTPSNASGSPWTFLSNGSPGMANGKTLSIHFQPNVPTLVSLRGIQYSFSSTFSANLFPIVTDNVYVFDPVGLTWFTATLTAIEAMSDYPGSTIGQTVINFNQEIILYGGFNTFVSLLSDRTSRVILSCAKNTSVVWTPFQPQLQPEDRQCASAIVRNGLLYVMGGWMRRLNTYNDVWSFDPVQQIWIEVPITTITPVASASLVTYNDQFYLFGGIFQFHNGTVFLRNTLTQINVDTLASHILTPSDGIVPTPRQLHTAVVDKDSMYVFGGVVCSQGQLCSGNYSMFIPESIDELWVYSFTNNTWRNLTHLSSPWPGPRNKHTAVTIMTRHGTEMLVYAGIGTHLYSDLWAFSFAQQRWRLVAPSSGISPGMRCWHFATAIGSSTSSTRMQIFNGVTSGPRGIQYYYDSWVYDSATNAWTQTSIGTTIGAKTTFSAYAYDGVSNTVYSFGGMQDAFEANSTATILNNLFTAQPGCNSGSMSPNYTSVPCQLCPRGTYAEGPGQTSCVSCSIGVTTHMTGSTSASDCNSCDSGSCSDKGTCVVDSSGFVSCIDCAFGYSGQYCGVTTVRDVIISVCILVPAVFLLALCLKSFFKKHSEVKLYRTQLDEANATIDETKKVFSIDFTDVYISRNLANGANGSISVAQYWGMEVAVKCLTNASLFKELDPEVYNQEMKIFAEEGKTLSSLHHVNIVRYFGTTLDVDGRPCLVMEFCSRGSLFRILNSSITLGWPELHQFASQCCLGMAYLHSRKRMHRDLKSLNLFVADDWVLKVGDFGTAKKFVGEDQEQTNIGTLQWMAPEILPGFAVKEKPHAFGASDVYSFGIVMWEIAARKEPYHNFPIESLASHISRLGERPDLSAVRAIIPREFVDVMRQAWAQESHERPIFQDLVKRLSGMKPVQRAFTPAVIERINAEMLRCDPSQLHEREAFVRQQGSIYNEQRRNSVSSPYVNVVHASDRRAKGGSVSSRYRVAPTTRKEADASPQLELLLVKSHSSTES
eukprot:m.134106 g.134106  ORF g.134106 m.134106 type:complete len:1328 (+) comp14840_c0_seq1:122-4105(+)